MLHFTTDCLLSLTWKYKLSFDLSIWTTCVNFSLRFLPLIRKAYWKYFYTFLSTKIRIFFVKLDSVCDLFNETLFTQMTSRYKNGISTRICVSEILRRAKYSESTKIASATICLLNSWHTEETFKSEVCQYSFIL